MDDVDLENLSQKELEKMLKDNEDFDAKLRAEAEENIGILEEKIQESRKQTDQALEAAKEILLQSISDRKERIAQLKSQNASIDEQTQQVNGETISFLTDITERLNVKSVTDVPREIEKLKALEEKQKT